MGKDQKALLRLWREKRGEEPSLDLSGVLVVQLGMVTEDLNRRWYELNTGNRVSDIQRHLAHRTIPWMAATLDGLVKATGSVFEAAEAHLDLLRIRRFRVALIKGCGLRGDASRENLMALGEQLSKIERYERRAFSRRMRALRLI